MLPHGALLLPYHSKHELSRWELAQVHLPVGVPASREEAPQTCKAMLTVQQLRMNLENPITVL